MVTDKVISNLYIFDKHYTDDIFNNCVFVNCGFSSCIINNSKIVASRKEDIMNCVIKKCRIFGKYKIINARVENSEIYECELRICKIKDGNVINKCNIISSTIERSIILSHSVAIDCDLSYTEITDHCKVFGNKTNLTGCEISDFVDLKDGVISMSKVSRHCKLDAMKLRTCTFCDFITISNCDLTFCYFNELCTLKDCDNMELCEFIKFCKLTNCKNVQKCKFLESFITMCELFLCELRDKSVVAVSELNNCEIDSNCTQVPLKKSKSAPIYV